MIPDMVLNLLWAHALLLLVAAAACCVFGLLCRLNMLVYRRHRIAVIGLHCALLVGSMAAGTHAWQAKPDLADIGVVVAAALYLLTTLPTWREAPPAHTLRDPNNGGAP